MMSLVNKKCHPVTFIVMMMISAICFQLSLSAYGAESKKPIEQLQALKNVCKQNLDKIEKRIQELLNPQPDKVLELSSQLSTKELETLQTQRQELVLKLNFYDRLISKIDAKFSTGNLRQFLQGQLSDMARSDLLDNSHPSNLSQMWKQMTFLSQVLRDSPDGRPEDVISLIGGYLDASSFKNPLDPKDYLRKQQYSNGKTSVAAAPMTPSQVGDLVEQRVHQVEHLKSVNSLNSVNSDKF